MSGARPEEDEEPVTAKAHAERTRSSLCFCWCTPAGWLIRLSGKSFTLTNHRMTPQHKTGPVFWHLTCEENRWHGNEGRGGKGEGRRGAGGEAVDPEDDNGMPHSLFLEHRVMNSPLVHLSRKARRRVCVWCDPSLGYSGEQSVPDHRPYQSHSWPDITAAVTEITTRAPTALLYLGLRMLLWDW